MDGHSHQEQVAEPAFEYRLASVHKFQAGIGYSTVSEAHRPFIEMAVRRGMPIRPSRRTGLNGVASAASGKRST